MAVAAAEDELLVQLGVGVPGFDPGASGFAMNLLGGDTDPNAYLFAVSTVLAQAAQLRAGSPDGPVDAHLQEIINTISDQLATLGQIAPGLHDELLAAQMAVDPDAVMTSLQARFDDLGWLEAVPNLHRILDSDLDGLANADDNCWRVENPGQEDGDMNGIGDACECGNGVVDVGEACDDGDGLDDNACSLACTINCTVTLLGAPTIVIELYIAVGNHLFYTVDDNTLAIEFGGAPVVLLEENYLYGAGSVAGLAVLTTNTGVYVSDGTLAGTTSLYDGEASTTGAVLDGRLFFTPHEPEPYEVWTTDGTIEGTQLAFTGAYIESFTVMNGKLYFRDGLGSLWETDGTDAGTQQIATPGAWQSDHIATLPDNKLVMAGDNDTLWVSDGTPNGTQQIFADIRVHSPFNIFNGAAYFVGRQQADVNSGLWKTDGTALGTEVILPESSPSGLDQLDGLLYFGSFGDLFTSDGTVNGTQPLDLANFVSAYLGAVGSRYFFEGSDLVDTNQLWSTDGTVEGSHAVLDIFEAPHYGTLHDLTVGPEHFYWRWDDSYENPPLHYMGGCRRPQ
jgi:hypothetical protein